MSRTAVVLFCITAGIVGTFANNYNFGGPDGGDQIEQLVTVLRTIDPQYLPQDFFANANDGYVGPRYYYAHLMAAMAHVLPLSALFLLLTILVHTALALLTFHVSRRLFGKGDLPAILAVALVLHTHGIELGADAAIAGQELTPKLLARPIALLSLWCALNGRTLWCVALAMPAILVHPLVGFETAAVGLVARAIELLWPGQVSAESPRRFRLASAAMVAVGLGAITCFSYLLFDTNAGPPVSLPQFIAIQAYCRAPHHYLPSTFPPVDYYLAAMFFLAAGLAWWLWKNSEGAGAPMPFRVLAVNVVLLSLLIGGYVFVEVFPSRLWITAQTFRMLSVAKWFALMLMAGTAGRLIGRRRTVDGSGPGWCVLMGAGQFEPIVVLGAHVLHMLQGAISAGRSAVGMRLLTGLLFIFCVAMGVDGLWTEPMGVLLVAGLGFWYLLDPPRWYWRWTPLFLVLGATWLLIGPRTPGFHIPRVLPRPFVTLDDPRSPCHALAHFAREHTPPESLFILPPDIANFQLIANRAAVVQWKAMPFSDRAMVQWYQRMRDCYGDANWKDLPPKPQLVHRYRHIPQSQLLAVAAKYGATHAVLDAATPCELTTLYQDARWKIVSLR
jgi:hypothetical protein